MENQMAESPRKTARMIGWLYVALILIGPFSLLYVPSSLIVPGDGAATASNIMASEGLFRAGMVGEVIIFLIEIMLPVLLYVLLKPVSKTLALVAMSARLAMAVMQAVNLLNKVMVLLLLSGADSLSVFEAGQLQALVMMFLDAHTFGGVIWGTFFGLHLIVLGYLVFRSGYLPRILGALLALGGVGYLADSLSKLLLPGNEAFALLASVLLGASALWELVFVVWLLVKGVNLEAWQAREAGQ